MNIPKITFGRQMLIGVPVSAHARIGEESNPTYFSSKQKAEESDDDFIGRFYIELGKAIIEHNSK